MHSLDDGLAKPTSNTRSTEHNIFTLKSFNPIYTVRSINTFCHFMISWPDNLNDINHHSNGDKYFYPLTICKSLSSKTIEKFTFPWDVVGDYKLLAIKLYFKSLSNYVALVERILIFHFWRFNNSLLVWDFCWKAKILFDQNPRYSKFNIHN